MSSITQYTDLYKEHCEQICAHAPALLNGMRHAAYERLLHERLPEKGDESYTALSPEEMFAADYGVNINRVDFPVDVASTFRCGVPNISTLLALVVNDTFRPTSNLMRNLPAGVTVDSLARVAAENPALLSRYLGKALPQQGNAAADLNTMLLQDGVFIHIPAGVALDRPVQVVNIFNAVAPVMGVRRIVVAVDAGASASVLVCDHSEQPDVAYLSNQVVEIYLGAGAGLEYYDMEESSAATSRMCQLYATQADDSRLLINGTTLLGGRTRNDYHCSLDGRGCSVNLAGMVVATDSQIVDTYTDVIHSHPEGASEQMFKYVLDRSSVGAFYGRIDVEDTAVNTKAYQSNRNLLASADARMYTRPQLEIYCDEVKCSHGATVGQLDAAALFYMRQRGIPEADARMMLMQAFMADVIDTVSIPALRTRLQQLVERRLAGHSALCADCGVGDKYVGC